MAIIQYSNGILEDFPANDLVFTDKELLNVLSDFETIRSFRLPDIPNSWCIWGENEIVDSLEFNTIATSMLGNIINSPLLIIHDSEIDPSWRNITDDIILDTYEIFRKKVLDFIDVIATNIISETQKIHDISDENMVFLNTLGTTKDKKVLFEFDITKQSKEFFESDNIKNFAWKIFNYWAKFFYDNLELEDNSCVLYADSKIIVIIKNKNVDHLMEFLISYFEDPAIEKYEICADIKNYHKAWKKYIKEQNSRKLLPESTFKDSKNKKEENKKDEK